MTNETAKRKQRIAQLTIALMLIVAGIYAYAFIKMPVWLPALK